MSAQDKNKIFFGLVHYILSEQANVNWIFKTSIINYTGAKQIVGDGDNTSAKLQDIIDFIYDMKPYHVQFSEFLQQMEIDSEQINVSIEEETDFTHTLRFDNVWSTPNDELQEEVEMGKFPEKKWYTTTMANRLYAMGMRDLDELKIELRADFKGKIINGGSSVEDKVGYDILMYDEDQYDSPSIIYDYCIRDFREDFSKEATSEKFTYEKEFPIVGTANFVFESDIGIDKTNLSCTIYRRYTDTTTPLTDYSIVKSGNYQFTMFQPLNEDDKLIIRIMNPDGKIRKAFVYVGSTFVPLDSGNIKRALIPLADEISVTVPESNISTKHMLVVKQLVSGTRIPFANYSNSNGNVIVHNFVDKEHIILSAFDYQFLYDLTFDYSDQNHHSNNTVIYTGGNFLRPEYNADRPEDLCVGHFSENLSIYLDDESKYSLDFKGENLHYIVSKIAPQKIVNVALGTGGYVEAFTVENSDVYPKDKQFYVQIGEEIIQVNKVSGNALGNLVRGWNGTPLKSDVLKKTDISVGDTVYLIPDVGKTVYEAQNRTISYYVGKYNTKNYNCPIETEETDTIEVYRLEVGKGVPIKMEENQYTLKFKVLSNYGKVVRDVQNKKNFCIYDTQGKFLYAVKNNLVMDAQNNEVGVVRRNVLSDMSGKKIGKVDANDNFVTSMIEVIPLIKLNEGDVLHISVIKQ